MELQFNREPCLILEATELLYVFVNQLYLPGSLDDLLLCQPV